MPASTSFPMVSNFACTSCTVFSRRSRGSTGTARRRWGSATTGTWWTSQPLPVRCAARARSTASLRRVPWSGFPDFTSTMGCSDSLTSIPPHFVAFVWRYRVCARSSLPGEGSAPAWVLGLITGCPPGIERGEIRPSQVPGGPPCMRAPLCDPDPPLVSGHLAREMLPSVWFTTSAKAIWILRG